MNALLHQLAAELKAYGGVMLPWIVLLILHVVGILTGEYWQTHELKHHPLLVLFRLSGFWVFLAALILSKVATLRDPPLDPDAFWRTKPISGWTLMMAKILAVGILFVLPVLILEGIIVARTGGLGVTAAVAVDHLLVRWAAMVGLLSLAALAGNSMRLLGMALGVLLAIGVITGVLSQVTLPSQFDYSPTLIASRFLIAGGCTWVGSVMVLHLLYQRRRFRLAGAVAGVTAGLLGLIFLVWPMDFYRFAPREGEAGLDSVRLNIRGADVVTTNQGADQLMLQSQLAQPSIPFMARLHKAQVRLGPRGGGSGWARIALDHQGGKLATAEQIALLDLPDPVPELAYDLSLRLATGQREHGIVPIDVEADVDVYAFVPVGELILEKGSTLRLAYGELEVLGLAWAPNQLLVEVREKVLQPMFALHGPLTVLPRSGTFGLWTLVLPAGTDGTPAQFAYSDSGLGPYVPPGQSEESLFNVFRYRHQQLKIRRLAHQPNSVELIEVYRGRRVQVLQRVYRGTVQRTAMRSTMPPRVLEGGQ